MRNIIPTVLNILKSHKKALVSISVMGIFLLLIAIYMFVLRPTSDTPRDASLDIKEPNRIVEVIIREGIFEPATAKIKIGDAVSWRSKDEDDPHRIAANPHPTRESLPDLYSDDLTIENAYTYTFNKPGTYHYHDFLHPEINGTIIVE